MDRKQAPKTDIDTKIPLIEPLEVRLDNGLSVYLLNGGAEEIVKVEVVFHAGSYYQQTPLQAFAVANLLTSGTRSRNLKEINERFDFYGTFLHADAQKDIASFSVFVLQKHLEQVLALFQDIIKYPTFPEEEMAVFLKNKKQQHLVDSQKVSYVARSFFGELLFGQGHPYGYRVDSSDFDKLSTGELLTFHRDYYHPANAFCIVSGNLPPNITDLLNTNLGSLDWPQKAVMMPQRFSTTTASEKKVLVQKTGALQSAVRIGRRLFNQTHPDYHKLLITNALFGGYFGSRLMQNIRQEKGYTYGIGSNLVSLLRDGYFFIGTEVGVDVCQKAIDEIYLEIKKLRCIPAHEHELSRLKSYLAGDFLRSFDGPFAQSQRYKEILAFRMDVTFFDAFLRELHAITPQQIMQTADKYLHEDSMMELVVGKK
jgi:zinc protease